MSKRSELLRASSTIVHIRDVKYSAEGLFNAPIAHSLGILTARATKLHRSLEAVLVINLRPDARRPNKTNRRSCRIIVNLPFAIKFVAVDRKAKTQLRIAIPNRASQGDQDINPVSNTSESLLGTSSKELPYNEQTDQNRTNTRATCFKRTIRPVVIYVIRATSIYGTIQISKDCSQRP